MDGEFDLLSSPLSPILGHRSRRRDIRGRVCDIHEGVQGAQRRAAGKRWNRRGMRGIISARPRPRADMTKGWCWWPPDAGWRAGCALANAALANAARIQGPGPWTYARTAPPAHHHHTTTTKRALPQPQPQPQGTTARFLIRFAARRNSAVCPGLSGRIPK
jgi:hypothetical protein